MYKKKKYKKAFMLLFLVSILLLIYLSINNKIYIEGYIRNVLYYPFLNRDDKDCKELNNVFNSELKKENEELKNLMDITLSLSDVRIVNATVLSRNTSEWFEFFTINKGKSDGIEIGMAVIDCGGLIGIIQSVTNNSAVVKLITSNDKLNKTSVKVIYGDTSSNVVMESDGNNGLVLVGINKNDNIKRGDLVVTSGLGTLFPNGIIIGYVDSVSYDDYKTSKKATVKLSYSIDAISYVSVLIVGG